MRKVVEEQEPGDPGEEEPRRCPEEVTGRGEKDNGHSNTGVLVEKSPSGNEDENQHDEEEMWLKDWWCPPLPFIKPVPAITHGELWQSRRVTVTDYSHRLSSNTSVVDPDIFSIFETAPVAGGAVTCK
ncbi:hypothetical protein NDU88_006802 [Pleurodeles waltl]|uniref:Uncharacterized protein n=1 Tax=Pleurodeles waltl TaxID=8319 RepID=A0AAV7X3U9_PLEWA|nr:hypothetical protein NDU88_006802 [Pleurodeles waltl]